jgi:antitoxin MazE
VQVSKWGNSLAIRLPASVVEVLKLKEGDEVDIRVAGERVFDISLDRSRERALERIKRLAVKLPPDWKFDRDEANAR